MSREPSAESDVTKSAKPGHGLDAEVPLIKILLYTDDPDDVVPDDKSKFFGLAFMLEHLRAREPTFGKLSLKWVSRNSSNQVHADQKLDKIFKQEQFDEIWFFGFHQANKKAISHRVFRGGPESELTEAEVLLLRSWMGTTGEFARQGGVLLTGDHNHPRPQDTVSSTNPLCPGSAAQPFLGRGRALGRCVPRAGQLRKWEDDPTNRDEDSHNTIAKSGLQLDKFPQELILRPVDAEGNPDPDGEPHPIFSYKPGQWIKFFPDHNHEGQVIVDLKFDKEWPGTARPHIVARGLDNRHAELVDLVATYNGQLANVGRIVADSSWHHYFNINVRPFAHPATEGSAADQIGQYYANLAVWLSPPGTRHKMSRAMLWSLAKYTALMEPLDNKLQIGNAAHAILREVASPCEANELIQALIPSRYGNLRIPEGPILSSLPSRELLLGSILNLYHREMIREEESDSSYKPIGVEEIIESGFKDALTEQATRLGLMAFETLRFMGRESV